MMADDLLVSRNYDDLKKTTEQEELPCEKFLMCRTLMLMNSIIIIVISV